MTEEVKQKNVTQLTDEEQINFKRDRMLNDANSRYQFLLNLIAQFPCDEHTATSITQSQLNLKQSWLWLKDALENIKIEVPDDEKIVVEKDENGRIKASIPKTGEQATVTPMANGVATEVKTEAQH